jgi:hypothetical protein
MLPTEAKQFLSSSTFEHSFVGEDTIYISSPSIRYRLVFIQNKYKVCLSMNSALLTTIESIEELKLFCLIINRK